MSRLVDHDATGPRKLDESDIDPEKDDIAVCQCGLSAEYPFCDGSHRETQSEDDDAWYRYLETGGDGERERKRVVRVVYADGESEDAGDDGD